MKKAIPALLFSLALIAPTTAFAAGKLSYTETFFVDSRSDANVYAKVENIGDKPIAVNAGLFEIFDSEGDAVTSTDWINIYAKYLQPGEYTYVRASTDINGLQAADVDDYLFTLSGKSGSDMVSKRFPCVAEYRIDDTGYRTYHYAYITTTNDTEDPVYGLDVVAAFYDSNDELIFVCPSGLGSDTALEPGSSLTFKLSISSAVVDYLAENNITPKYVDAIVYVNRENDLAD